MAFVRLDPSWVRSPKLCRLSRVDRLAWVELLSWCVEQSTNGAGSGADLRRIWPELRAGSRNATMQRLQDAGLVDALPDDRWQMHDFLDYQQSAEDVKAQREAARERQRRFRQRHGSPSGAQKRKATTKGGTNAVTAPGRNGVTQGGRNAPLPSPPSLTGGEEGKSNTHRKVAARPTGGRSSTNGQGSMAETGKLAKELLSRLETEGDAA